VQCTLMYISDPRLEILPNIRLYPQPKMHEGALKHLRALKNHIKIDNLDIYLWFKPYILFRILEI
ncbi:MAG: hypothetical protein RSC99_10455, partial [Clostridiales bacterium]